MSDEERQKAAEEDERICRIVNTRECWESAAERDAARARGKPVPPLRTGVKGSWNYRSIVTGAGALSVVGAIACVIIEPCGASVAAALTIRGSTSLVASQ